MNYMQRRFASITAKHLEGDSRLCLLFAGSGIVDQSYFDDISKECNGRIVDLGISEQAAIGVAAGLAVGGSIPVFHTQSPFIVERAYEQLKLDFGYQCLPGNFVGLGGSIEFTLLGPTHNCPADVGALKLIPNFEIIVPGTEDEFERLFEARLFSDYPTYYRLSRDLNSVSFDVEFGKAEIVKRGNHATIIAVGPMLQMVIEACEDLDVTILYYTTLAPFDSATLRDEFTGERLFVVEPFYCGALLADIASSLEGKVYEISEVALPIKFFDQYGLATEWNEPLGLTSQALRDKVVESIL